VTTIEPGRPFDPAEAYHQDFLTRHPRNAYIAAYDRPNLEELRRTFRDLYRADPILVTANNLSN
jgi:peptide-methionine (S)-S-oxide reductase